MDAVHIYEWLDAATTRLAKANIPTARLDSLILLEDLVGKDRSWILAHPEHSLRKTDLDALEIKLVKRARHIPLAYIRGKAEFYGREFTVNNHTLVPRPETETIIDLLKQLEPPRHTSILDVGTGSGCIAITTALELQNVIVGACDIDSNCLDVATQNASRLGVKIDFFKSDLLNQASNYDVIVANLPYVPNGFRINTAATHEPRRALFGGQDGLDLYRQLFEQLGTAAIRSGHILTESLPIQHDMLAAIAKAAGFALKKTDDFIQLFELAI